MEHLYIVTKNDKGGVDAVGVAEREAAHRLGLRHATTICALVVADGPDAGKILVHDRYAKLLGKAEGRARQDAAAARKAEQLRAHPLCSLNLFGGHLAAPNDEAVGEVCHTVEPAEMLACMLHELSEELALTPRAGEAAGRSVMRRLADGSLEALPVMPFPLEASELTCLGYAEYTSPFNEEISTLFVMPVAAEQAARLIAADNYYDADGRLVDIALPIKTLSLSEAQAMYGAGPKPDQELCDAFTRLLPDRNRDIWALLKAYVEPYRLVGETYGISGAEAKKSLRGKLTAALAAAEDTLEECLEQKRRADEAFSAAKADVDERVRKESKSPFGYAMPGEYAAHEEKMRKAAKQAADAARQAERLVALLRDALRRLDTP